MCVDWGKSKTRIIFIHHAEAEDNIYPAHVNALRKASLAPPVFPTMGDLWIKQDEKVEKKKELDVSVKKNRNVYCFVA